MLCPVFRRIIFGVPLLDVNFRCKSLCYMLFIHSVGTKSLYILLGKLSYLLCHFLWVKFEIFVLMSDVVMLYVGSRVLAFLVAIFASAAAVSLSLIPLRAGQ